MASSWPPDDDLMDGPRRRPPLGAGEGVKDILCSRNLNFPPFLQFLMQYCIIIHKNDPKTKPNLMVLFPHIELMRGHFLFQTVVLLFSSALSFERFCDGPAFKLAAAAFVGRRSALQAYALSQPVKKPLMGFASMAPIRMLHQLDMWLHSNFINHGSNQREP